MKKFIIFGLFFSSLIADSFTIMPYSSFLDYGANSQKKEGLAFGIYGSYYHNAGHKIEIGYEKLDVKYYQDKRATLKQYDTTIIYSRYLNLKYIIRGGIHYIDSTDTSADKALVYILGIKKYEGLKKDYGVDFYYSDYKNKNPKLSIYQISPYYGFAFGDFNSKIGSFYLKGRVNYMKTDSNQDRLKAKTSANLTLNNYNGKFITTLDTMFGKEIYAVLNDGFTAYDNENIYKSSLSLALQYAINKKEYIKIKLSTTKFEDEESKKVSTLSSGTLFYGINF